VGLRVFLVAVLPHGIFELPAFVISGALGLMLANSIWAETKGGGAAADVAVLLCRKFLILVIPQLLIAAVVEAFITPQILNVMI
jgi:stage II sporulation protein M